MLNMGPEVLSDAELFAIILRTGSPNENVIELYVGSVIPLRNKTQIITKKKRGVKLNAPIKLPSEWRFHACKIGKTVNGA